MVRCHYSPSESWLVQHVAISKGRVCFELISLCCYLLYILSTLTYAAAAARCIQLLKDDEALRLRLGAAGRETVSTRTVEYVVKDLFQWYAQGTATRWQRRSPLSLVGSTLALLLAVPSTIAIFCFYNTMVMIMM